MKIEVVSDIACPWCAVGVYALDRAIAAIGSAIPVELSFEPFELNPDMPLEGEDLVAHLSAKYGIDAAQIRANQQVIRERGADVGFDFGTRTRIWNTFDAHRLLHWAALEGKQHEVKRALLQAYHGEGRNPASHAVLVEVAARCGMNRQRAAEILAGDEFAAAVRANEQQWLQSGIHSVPSVVVNRRYLIQGARSPGEYERALRQIAAQR
jgi:predicted DsbA family dithiol-disulfide isomerase